MMRSRFPYLPTGLILFAVGALSGPLSGCAPDEPPLPAARDIETLTEAHTRVVWVQDTNELTDVFAAGDQLRLMGYDSRDGEGERVILPGPANFMKPMFTPDGEYILYSVIEEDATYQVRWDGSGHQRVTGGMVLATWRDPDDQQDWIYVGRERRDERGFSFHRIVRMPLDNRGDEETVWTQTLLQMDNFQLSADGRRASGLFPWPEAGVARLPDEGYERLARGCWTALAPDNSYILWTFDGAHRNLLMNDTRRGEEWQINVSRAEPIGGHEAYHPRWSNHPRFMTLTGPYTIREGGNNIRGGGAEVEVHIGQFSEDYREIARWVRVTDNPYANVFPDVWIDLDEAVRAGMQIAHDDPPEEAALDPEKLPEWPVTHEGLLFFWKNREADNEWSVPGEDRAGRPEVEPADRARYGRHFEMDVRQGYFVAAEVGKQIVQPVAASGAFSVEAVITPAELPAGGDGRVVAWGTDPESVNVALRLEGSELLLEGVGIDPVPLGTVPSQEPTHLLVAVESDRLAFYLNGEEVTVATIPEIDFDAWTPQPLFWGGLPSGALNWSGYIEGVAVYARAVSASEAREKASAYAMILDAREPPETVTVKARLTDASSIPAPEDIAPYQRGMVVNEYEVIQVLDGEMDATEILVAHWVILDGNTLDDAERHVGEIYTLAIELYDQRPELEGERLSKDSERYTLGMYYDTTMPGTRRRGAPPSKDSMIDLTRVEGRALRDRESGANTGGQ